MRKLSPQRRRTAATAGLLAAAAGAFPALHVHQNGSHEDLAFGLLFGVGLGLTLLMGLRGGFGRDRAACVQGRDDAR